MEIGERVVSDSSAVPTTIGDVSVTTSAAAAATTTTVLSQVLFSSCNHTVIGSRSGSGVLHFSLNYPFFVVVVVVVVIKRVTRSFSSPSSSSLSGERWSSDDDDTDDTTVCYRRLRYLLYSHYLY
jgi:hypothetical protein